MQARQVLWVSNSSEDVGWRHEAGRACGHVIGGSLAPQRAPEARGTARATRYSPRSAEGGRNWSDIMLPYCHAGDPPVLRRTSQ